jgi:hypothetical protein
MVNYQHVGPIGQYQVPKDPRFRYENYQLKSITPGIEVIKTEGSGGEGTYYRATLRVDGRTIAITGSWAYEEDEFGSPVYNYVRGKAKAPDMVFFNVKLFYEDDTGSSKIQRIPLSNFSDRMTQIVLEFLTVDRSGITRRRVARVIFSDDEPIVPRNYRVTYDV